MELSPLTRSCFSSDPKKELAWRRFCWILIAVVMFGIVAGLSSVLPSAVHMLGFIRYALAGFWVLFLAPLLFVKIGLAIREDL